MANSSGDYTGLETPLPDSVVQTDQPWREKPSPMGSANWLVDALILWLDPLMFRGAKQTLKEEDVWRLAPADTAEQLQARFNVYWNEEKTKPSPSVARALMRTIHAKWWYTVGIFVLYAAFTLVQPSVIRSLLEYLQTPEGNEVHTTLGLASGYALAALLTALSFVSVTLVDYGQYLSSNLGVNVKSIVMDSVYQKTLKLSGFAKRSMTSGEIVTLTSVDSERLFQGLMTGPWVLVGPPNVFVIYIFIGFNLGYVVGLVGGLAMALLLFIGFKTSTKIGTFRRELLQVQSNRVKLTNEILQGVRVIKLFAWETYLEEEIAVLREQELAILKKYQSYRILNTVTLSVAPILSFAICLAVYTAQGNTLTPSVAFTTLAYMNVARLPCTVFSTSIIMAYESLASCKRLGEFLLSDEIDDTKQIEAGETATIEITDGNFSWNVDPCEPTNSDTAVATPLTLNNIYLTITPKSLTIIVGAVGSGKSSLINAILGEIQQVSGTRRVAGRISYVSQEPWIQHASLKDNILFAGDFDEDRYDRVLAACQLKTDLAILPQGDATEIGERGINLSGGQKARVSLARAMYRENADIYLFDDPLSALDVHVAGAVFQECIQNLLADKTVVLVLNSHYHFLPKADRVLVMEDGTIVGDGSFDLIKEKFPHLNSFDAAVAEDDFVVVVPLPDAPETSDANDGALVEKEDQAVGAIASSVYITYFKSTGWNGLVVLATILVAFSVSQAAVVMTDWFMGHWAAHPGHSTRSVVIYCVLAFGSVALLCWRSLFIVSLSVRASRALHSQLFEKVVLAPVNTFFDVTPIGRILNRFSSDLDQADSLLAFFSVLALQFSFQIAAVIVVCAVTSPYILIVYAPLIWMFQRIQVFYSRSSSELKRLESVTRTPVINMISETISGLTTIRAFDMTRCFSAKSRGVLDHNLSYFMIYVVASRWLQMRLDWISAIILAGVSFLTVATKSTIGVTAAGLALTYASQMSGFLSRVTMHSSMVENIMTCVERLDYYNHLTTEGDTCIESQQVPSQWPTQGTITFESYSMRYRDHLDLVLRDVSFEAKGGEKIGICGRTGSGKSTLMVALFRMVEASSGCIKIDGVDISKINLKTLRSRLTIIPQDPVIFSGSLRFNIDPSQQASDADLWDVLKKVHLADGLEGGLDFQVAEKGGNLSVGQRQLLCIARALLRQSRVVVLDEATANIDLESDRLIQQTIKECFRDVTMLIIAHRLDTIIDSDKILVMDRGSVVEFDTPKALLAQEGGVFTELARQAHISL
ncbi:hypothetical protein LEN26_003771 [Aphanomyces euteiches]|nr:hypothetical protein LEN26_003771 [Aphanomyces euteiches]